MSTEKSTPHTSTPSNPNHWIITGHHEYNSREYLEALTSYTEALEMLTTQKSASAQGQTLDIEIRKVHGYLALTSYELGQFEKTITYLSKALNFDATLSLQAAAHQKATEISPFDPAAWEHCATKGKQSVTELCKGKQYLKENQIGKALVCFHKTIELKPASIEAYVELGLVHYRLGNTHAAELIFKWGQKMESLPHLSWYSNPTVWASKKQEAAPLEPISEDDKRLINDSLKQIADIFFTDHVYGNSFLQSLKETLHIYASRELIKLDETITNIERELGQTQSKLRESENEHNLTKSKLDTAVQNLEYAQEAKTSFFNTLKEATIQLHAQEQELKDTKLELEKARQQSSSLEYSLRTKNIENVQISSQIESLKQEILQTKQTQKVEAPSLHPSESVLSRKASHLSSNVLAYIGYTKALKRGEESETDLETNLESLKETISKSKMMHLDLSSCDLTKEDIEIVLDLLKGNKSVRSLDIRGNGLEDQITLKTAQKIRNTFLTRILTSDEEEFCAPYTQANEVKIRKDVIELANNIAKEDGYNVNVPILQPIVDMILKTPGMYELYGLSELNLYQILKDILDVLDEEQKPLPKIEDASNDKAKHLQYLINEFKGVYARKVIREYAATVTEDQDLKEAVSYIVESNLFRIEPLQYLLLCDVEEPTLHGLLHPGSDSGHIPPDTLGNLTPETTD